MRFQVLTAAGMKFKVFWDVAPCDHIESDWQFIILMMEAVHTSEMLIHFNMTTRHYIPDNSKLNSLFTLKIIKNPLIQNAELLIVKAAGTYSYRSALKSQ
jgi:hypothetical protein